GRRQKGRGKTRLIEKNHALATQRTLHSEFFSGLRTFHPGHSNCEVAVGRSRCIVDVRQWVSQGLTHYRWSYGALPWPSAAESGYGDALAHDGNNFFLGRDSCLGFDDRGTVRPE